MALDRHNEYCIGCGDPTGRAGNFEESLFIDDEGPFCDDCYKIRKDAEEEQRMKELFG